MKSRTFLFLSLFAIGCSTESHEASRSIFRVPITAIPDLELKYGDDINGNKIVNNVFENLVTIDESLSPEPEIASWKINGQEIEFEIKPKTRFHDGSYLTSQDVLDSFIRAAKNTSKFTSQIDSFDQCIKTKTCVGFRILNSTRFVIRIRSRNFELLLKHLASAEASIIKKTGDKLIGTGPYKIDEISQNQIIAEKFDERAQFERILFLKLRPQDACAMFLSGNLDTISDLDCGSGFELSENLPSIRKLAGTYALFFQTKKGIFRKRENRIAIAHSINPKEFMNAYGQKGISAGGMIPFGYSGHSEINSTLDIEKAKALILRNTNANERTVTLGVRDSLKNNKPIEKYLTEALHSIGLRLNIKYLPFDEMLQGLRLRTLDIVLKGESPVNSDPSTLFISYSNGLSQRLQGYQNRELAELFLKYQNQSEKNEQLRILKKMESAFIKDVPAIPLFYPIFTTWYRADLSVKNAGTTSVKFWNFSYQDIQPTMEVQKKGNI